jgi:hypothetical protein
MSEEKDDKWEMPKPKFQSSEGTLPRSLEETISQSFITNAETLEFDESDDILGIMDSALLDAKSKESEDGKSKADNGPAIGEITTEIDPAQTTEIDIEEIAAEADEVAPTVESETKDTVTEDNLITEGDPAQPIVVTPKKTVVKAPPKSGGSWVGLIIFVLLALVVIGGAALYFVFMRR